MSIFHAFVTFFKRSPAIPLRFDDDEAARQKYYRKLRWSTFLSATIGYSLYYVARTSLNVVKKPIMESGILNAEQLGYIGSALLFTYAIGKFVNGFLADHSNIKRFMAIGLLVSALANLLVGIFGWSDTATGVSSASFFILFIILWGINGWSQSMGAAPAIISLSRWFPIKQRGTYYGFFSASHNFGEFLSFLFVGIIVGLVGWQWGFIGAAISGVIGVLIILLFMHDNPESKGLPVIETLVNEKKQNAEQNNVLKAQRNVLKNPYVWILALASAFMYISRYAINSWGVLFLQEEKGFSLALATQIISINALLGIIGTVFSGWFSDTLFKGKRNMPALIFGVMNAASLVLFIYSGNSLWVNILSMILFGIAIGVLICFVGGLMAVDIVPRNATGAVLGIIGATSYLGAGLQDIVSGTIINKGKTVTAVVNGVEQYHYDFSTVGIFWIAAACISFVLAALVWNAKAEK